MRTLLSIDPGRCTGWAYWVDSSLTACGVTEVGANPCPAVSTLLNGCQALIVELPQVYRAAESKGDPNDLIQVAVEVGRWVERGTVCGSRVRLVRPAEWKGQTPKEVHHRRVQRALGAQELARLPDLPKTKAHNMMDAIGLGLWQLERMR